jgi:hypothetical protein
MIKFITKLEIIVGTTDNNFKTSTVAHIFNNCSYEINGGYLIVTENESDSPNTISTVFPLSEVIKYKQSNITTEKQVL